jgi:hypothetical protein
MLLLKLLLIVFAQISQSDKVSVRIFADNFLTEARRQSQLPCRWATIICVPNAARMT